MAHPPRKVCKISNLSKHVTDHVHSNLLIYGRIEHCINTECPEHQYNNYDYETEKIASNTVSTMSGISAKFVLLRYLHI